MSLDLAGALGVVDRHEREVREFFKSASSPYLYVGYRAFLKHFEVSEMNFKEQNLNIIDVHLRYRWWVREKMVPLKWLPIVLLTPLIYRSYAMVLLVPWFTVNMFDHYFQRFYLWRYRNERVINLRNEFVGRLSKEKNKVRRVALFNSLRGELRPEGEEKLEAPIKYIKFGEFTQYIFHAIVDGREQSSLLQTTFFETYLNVKNILWELSSPSNIWGYIKDFKDDFVAYRNDPNRNKYYLNIDAMVDRPDLKDVQIYTLEDNIDHNVRRWSQLWSFLKSGSLQPSDFKLWEYTNFSNYRDIFEPLRYNLKDNWPDLIMYYSILGLPKLLNVLFKRR